ncbi:MAG: hypothetical protein ISS72_07665 [Candidatus Brocadiae bacterium]|nr:hypothetical protein [Candidatus Brocadiia bacterium]
MTPALGGWFRPGRPVLLWVTLENDGGAVVGSVDVVVEGIAYRWPFGVGAMAETTVGVLAAVHGGRQRVRVRAEDGRGATVCDVEAEVALRQPEAGRRLVLAVGKAEAPARELFAGKPVRVVGVAAEGAPLVWGAWAAADAVVLRAHGGGLSEGVLMALRGGGLQGGLTILLAEADGQDDEARDAAEWLHGPSALRETFEVGDGVGWRHGLGMGVAGSAEDLAKGDLMALMPPPGERAPAVDEGLYGLFDAPRMDGAGRWRWVGIAVGLLVAGAVVVWVLCRRGRWLVFGLSLAACAALGAATWGALGATGRGVVEAAGLRVDGGLALEVVQVGGVGRGRVRVALGRAAAVVPAYYGLSDVGSWDDVVLEQDAAGRWHLECAVRCGVRRCFVVTGLDPSAAGPRVEGAARKVLVRRGAFRMAGGEAWRPLRELAQEWDGPAALVRWQASRLREQEMVEVSWGPRRMSAARPERGVAIMRHGPVVEWRRVPE